MTRLLLLVATVLVAASAQLPPLRITGPGRTVSVDGMAIGAATTGYPVTTLALFGASLVETGDGVRAVAFGDTLAFWSGSPFFTAGRSVHQLIAPVARTAGGIALPRQFFTDWLPRRFPDRFEYRSGVLRVSFALVAAAAPDTARARTPRAPPQRVVILDPGHGGNDPGKIGPNRLREKDVALQLAKRLAATLSERSYEVHLTRTADTLIALADRPRLANNWKNGRPSAVFLSIHMNSVASSAVRGFETFFLSQARTEDERRVAEMENAAVAFEERPAGPLTEEDLILTGLRNDFYVRASSDLADEIQRGLAGVHTGPDRGVKRAGFRVLVGALMPAVLIEVAFISNRDEARLIGQVAFQKSAALAIADAVDRFFAAHEHLWAEGPS